MTLPLDLYFDQQRLEQESLAVEELFLEGETDGYKGIKPASSDERLPGWVRKWKPP